MLAVTGANGNLGRRLLRHLANAPPLSGAAETLTEPAVDTRAAVTGDGKVRALVRSASAVGSLRALDLPGDFEFVEVDYLDVESMTQALAGCSQVVHLVGIIRETRANHYVDAHERPAEVLVEAAARAGVQRIVALSILGANERSTNACLGSRGRADVVLQSASLDVVVLRVPMVLGEDDYAARALAARAGRPFSVTLRAASLEQPIYVGDVVAAICAALGGAVPGRQIVELAGPETLTRRALTDRAARLLGRSSRTVSLPLGIGLVLAALFERFSANPPITRAMLGVLDHDDRIDPLPAAARLGIALTPLDVTLRHCLGLGLGSGRDSDRGQIG